MGYSANDRPFPRGEICVKTKHMTLGYYRMPKETAAAYIVGRLTANRSKLLFLQDGFFHTGDIGTIDDKGLLHIIDRKKNMLELYVKGRSVWVAASTVEN